ncbi:MAG: 2-oxo acid dehydrogenase subunit E2 [Actinobacteria bacterium]|nr:MAG: 2-oxo acid dehydrogenase subunit E2 [Actinomycetota bacterium]
MATEIKLPRLGQGMESGTIVRWLKSEGEPVEKGEPLYELDTDKVTQEVEADASGVLLRIAVEEGEVEVGRTIALIGQEGESVPDEAPAPAPEEPAKPEAKRAAPAAQTLQQTVARSDGRGGGRIKASPLARRIARERGVELSSLQGTGPEGRIVAEDVERAAAAPAPAAAVPAPPFEAEVVPLTSLRRTVARRMTEAWQAPAFQISTSADMTRALAIRARLVERGDTPKPTISDLLTKVSAAALMRHREVNALYEGDAVRLLASADIGMAVATERGLLVPVIRGCERLTIPEIAAARADLVERARSGKLQQADLEGGSFTISNLGMYGVEQFVAVLNPPQAAILAVGAVQETPVARDGAVEIRPLMTMTLTCDHRSVDGATAADFLRTLKTFLEEPGLAL